VVVFGAGACWLCAVYGQNALERSKIQTLRVTIKV
jgi:hypothetical protein